MIVNAARQLGVLAAAGKRRCFVGIGLPSTAANLARRLYPIEPVLIYESGCIGSKPTRLPLSIGDGELAETSDAVVSVPGDLRLLAAGRAHRHRLPQRRPARQVRQHQLDGDRFATSHPTTRLPGAGGAPEIAASAGAVMVIMRQSTRAFVERCDFRTSIGFGDGKGDRERFGLRGGGPKWVITDLAVMEPDPDTCELVVVALHPGVTASRSSAATGWAVRFADRRRRRPREPTDERARRAAQPAGGMNPFTYDQLPARIVFGAGRLAEVGAEVERLGGQRVMLISDGRRDSARRGRHRAARGRGWRWRGTRSPSTCPSSSPSGPVPRRPTAGIDCVVCIGGGSSTGLGQGDGVEPRRAHRRRADHVRRQRADDDLRAHRRAPQADRQEPGRAAQDRRLRPRADGRPAAAGHRSVGVQRARALASRRCTRPATTRSRRRWHSRACAPSTSRCRR